MDIKIYDTLPAEAVQIRESVFVEEQGFCEEFDTTDYHAWHLVCFEQEVPIGTCRFFKEPSKEHYIIGRIAVMKQYRGKNIGSRLLNAAEHEIEKFGGKSAVLHAQERAKEFYQKQGYREYGEIDFEQDCPHIWMCKHLTGKEAIKMVSKQAERKKIG